MIALPVALLALASSVTLVAGEPTGGALPTPSDGSDEGPNLVIVTVDGVRWREVFQGTDPGLGAGALDQVEPGLAMPRLRARLLRQGGLLAGDVSRGDPFRSHAPPACSLPGYQVLFTGEDRGCPDNDCPRVDTETVLERVRRELGLARGEVAVFAGWPPIARAVARDPDSLLVNVGAGPSPRPDEPDAEADRLDAAAAADLPPWGHRADRYTWALAMNELARRRPRLLYVGLGDPDEWGHLGDYGAYVASIRAVDGWLEALEARLAQMGAWGRRTSVLVTTDHGRGKGPAWDRHGAGIAGSDLGFLYASTPETRRVGLPGRGGGRDLRSVRPTIEALFGLAPCPRCGAPIAEVLPPPALARRRAPEASPASGAGGP